LFGLKENVIIGKLIPAGTGFVRGRFTEEGEPTLETSQAVAYPGPSIEEEEDDLTDLEFSLAD
jgi:hypothetical protein